MNRSGSHRIHNITEYYRKEIIEENIDNRNLKLYQMSQIAKNYTKMHQICKADLLV